MNKMIVGCFLILTAMFSGCVSFPAGYTPHTDLKYSNEPQKYDLTYSMSYASVGDYSIGKANKGRMQSFIEQALMDSGAYSSIMYRNLNERSSHHIHFMIQYSMPSVKGNVLQGLFIYYTFFLIPTWKNMYLDMSAILFHQDQKVFSCATSENLRCYVWLPLAPAGMVWNNWLAWTRQERNSVNYLLNQMTDFQKKQLEQKTAEESDFE